MKVSRVKNLMLSGISITTNNKNEQDEEKAKIPGLWDDYVENRIETKTHDKANNSFMFGVYSDYESDLNGDYKVTLAVEVTKPKKAMIIEDQRYLVFDKKGELPDIVIETWKEIWDYFENNSEYERAYAVDFEKYSKREEVEIFISIKS